jgi:hypothetical protein
MSHADFKRQLFLEEFLRVLPRELVHSFGNESFSEGEIYRIALDLRQRKKIPFYPRSIGSSESYSMDIHYCIEILRMENFLKQESCLNGAERIFQIDLYSAILENTTNILKERNVPDFCARKMENLLIREKIGISSMYTDLFEREHSYLFTHLGCLNERFYKVDLSQLGIDSFRDLTSQGRNEKTKRFGYEERALSKVGRNFTDSQNAISSNNVRVSAMKRVYQTEREEIEGLPICVIGIFDDYERVESNHLYRMKESILLGSPHTIDVVLSENGKFKCERIALLERECLLLGVVQNFLDKPVIRAAGVIKVDPIYGTIPVHTTIPRRYSSEQPSPVPTIVREKNGTETYVEGGHA